MKLPRVLIAGAGLGGLTAALALLQRGFDVEVHEQAPVLREVGAGIQMSANGTRVLYALGLQGALSQHAVQPTGKEIRLWDSGQSWRLFDLGNESLQRYGYPYLMLHRADLLKALVDGIMAHGPDIIRLGRKVVGCSETAGGSPMLHFEDGGQASGDVLVGADGVHSQVRGALFGADAPEFTGCLAWRGLVPMAQLPEALRQPVGTNWIGPRAHVVHYPVRRGQLLNFVGIVERDDWRLESWTQQGSIEECAADFTGWHDYVQQIIARLGQPYKWALMVRQPLPRWSLGRTTLLGDACHPTLPFLAQGAMMAIEDGMVLARCLAMQPDQPEQALLNYQNLRLERTHRIVLGSAENAKRFHAQALSDRAQAQTYIEREWDTQRVAERYGWLFEYDATAVPT